VRLEDFVTVTAVLNTAVDAAANGRVFNSAQNGDIFCSVSGRKSRYMSGSHVDCNDLSAVIGTGAIFEMAYGELTSIIFTGVWIRVLQVVQLILDRPCEWKR
jgi:hypothetical protein